METTRKFGEKVYYFEKVTSTMDIARELAEKGEPEGSIVIAARQDAGRGRFRRKWYSPPGGIYFSLILRPGILPSKAGKINLLAAVSIAEILKEFYALPAKIKWPNDVLVRGKKISGILTEMKAGFNKLDWIILGIGINANNPQRNLDCGYLYPATSIKEEIGRKISSKGLVKRLLAKLEKEYFAAKRKGFASRVKEWKRLSATLGQEVKVETAEGIFFGKAIALDSEGALILRIPTGERKKILAGDCHHLGKKLTR